MLTLVTCVALCTCNIQTYPRPQPQFSTRTGTFIHPTIEKLSFGGSHLSVFIEGDGKPWIDGKAISKDPSPQDLLALHLMEMSTGNRMYLGRPCYFGTDDSRCDYRYWTSHRYSAEVVSSMADVINQIIRQQKIDSVTLVGHSGGGTLATLISCQLHASVQLITLGANLDVEGWVKLHHYTPLQDSLDPLVDFPGCKLAKASHYAGGLDTVVPPAIVEAFANRFHHDFVLLETADHRNWAHFWPVIFPQSLQESQQ